MASPALIVGVSVAAGIAVLVIGCLAAFCLYMHKNRSDATQTPVKRMKTDARNIKMRAGKLKTSTLNLTVCCCCCRFTQPHRILLPDPPQRISLVNSGTHRVTVSWCEPEVAREESRILHFKIYKRFSKSPDEWCKVGKAKPGSMKFVVKYLVPETRYVFGVASVNKGGISAIVESDPILVKGLNAIPGPPADVRIHQKFKNTITLTWKPPKKRTEVRILSYHVMIQDGAWTDLVVLTAFDRYMEHKIIDLDLHTPYRFRIAAENEFGRGPPTETDTVILTGEPDVPSKPAGPLKYSHITHHSVSLSWKPPSQHGSKPLTGYGIELYDPRKEAWHKCGACDASTTSFNVTKLSENVTYRFRVVAMNEVGNGTPLAGKTIKTKLHEIPLAQRSGSRMYSRMDTSRSSNRSHGTTRSLPSTTGSTRHIGIHLNGSAGGSLNGDLDSEISRQRQLLDTRESGVQTERDMIGPSISNTETSFETETGSTLTDTHMTSHESCDRPFNMAFSMANRNHLQHLHRSINDRLQLQEQK